MTSPRASTIRLVTIGADRVVDNEKELYLGYIRRLEFELDRAHELNRDLLKKLLDGAGVAVKTEPSNQEPIQTRPMSFQEASRRVKEFEKSQRESTIEQAPVGDHNASKDGEAIQVHASDSPRGDSERRGYAV